MKTEILLQVICILAQQLTELVRSRVCMKGIKRGS